ncbi:MAG: thymidine kinase [Bacteroidia bacterium]
MFLEIKRSSKIKSGWIEVVCGSMFSGKTEELIRRVKRGKIARQEVKIFKPSIDVRYHKKNVVSHDMSEIQSIPVSSSKEILQHIAPEDDIIAVDEAQFFDNDLPEVCNAIANQGKRVIVAGLDMDFKGIPFGPMPQIVAMAEYVSKVKAICVDCGNLAHFSHRLAEGQDVVLLGEKKEYIPLCRNCFNERTSQK